MLVRLTTVYRNLCAVALLASLLACEARHYKPLMVTFGLDDQDAVVLSTTVEGDYFPHFVAADPTGVNGNCDRIVRKVQGEGDPGAGPVIFSARSRALPEGAKGICDYTVSVGEPVEIRVKAGSGIAIVNVETGMMLETPFTLRPGKYDLRIVHRNGSTE